MDKGYCGDSLNVICLKGEVYLLFSRARIVSVGEQTCGMKSQWAIIKRFSPPNPNFVLQRHL
jgi:hypothetical protein